LGIPEQLDDVVGHEIPVASRDRNQFGNKFGAYRMISDLGDMKELDTWFLKSRTHGFQGLRKHTTAYLETCWINIKAGFQPILAKIMQYDDNKRFFRAVQQKETISDYGEIWAQVLWLGCISMKDPAPAIAKDVVLTLEQSRYATELLFHIEDTLEMSDDERSRILIAVIASFSAEILRQQFDVVNHVDDSGVSSVSQFLIPRAINLLSLKPNGTFLRYGQITHNVAAITYCLRCTFVHNVASRLDPLTRSNEIVDTEISQSLNPTGSTAFSYCVQVHGACRTYGFKHILPTITWGNGEHNALRLESGEILTIASLKDFAHDLVRQSKEMLKELTFGIELPRHLARDLIDHYSDANPGYSFITEKRNGFDRRLLLKNIMGTAGLRGRFLWGNSIVRVEALYILQA
ncbi:hypothetical protein V1525DRAFT_351435, partial [Lipomyces kononenkoae]